MLERGLLGPQLLAVHLTEATPDEAAMIARSGARMAVCNGSIGIIDGIVCPAVSFRSLCPSSLRTLQTCLLHSSVISTFVLF